MHIPWIREYESHIKNKLTLAGVRQQGPMSIRIVSASHDKLLKMMVADAWYITIRVDGKLTASLPRSQRPRDGRVCGHREDY
jgi:hypothetical protein